MISVTISRRSAFIIVLALLLVIPMAAYAGSVFEDVDDTNTHIDGMTYLKNSGVSAGCDSNNNFCPDDNVTRAQMATFMYRLSGNDPATPPSVIAASAGDADTVGGYAPTDLIRSAGVNAGGGLFLSTPIGVDSTVQVMSTTIEAPVAGYLIINASANLYCAGFIAACAQSSGNTWINVNDSQYARQYYAIDGDDSAANRGAWNSSNSAHVAVDAGTHSVGLDVVNGSTSAGATNFWSGGLNVLFVPFGSDGSVPTGAVEAPAVSGDVVQEAPSGD